MFGFRLCDEATSALDASTEAEILGSLRNLKQNRTAVFVSHRLTTAMLCDEIVVLEHGKVAERGGHEELLTRGGRYAQLWQQQNTPTDLADAQERRETRV